MSIKRFYLIPLFLLAFPLFSFIKNNTGDSKPFIVVLDAGHGGHDPGNLGNGYLEKDIALKIVLKVGEILKKEKDIKVIYTRDDDTFVDLYVRGEIANKANADLFVSVHCDSHSSDAHGAGTFVLGLHANKQNFEIAKKENSVIYLENNYRDRYAKYDINSPESVIGLTIMQEEFLDQSILLARMMQDNFSKKLRRTDRKVKQAGFIVLHQTFMPSVLVETGFLTNKKEGAYLNSKKGQAEMGNAIAQAILKYKKEIKPVDIPSDTSTPSPTKDTAIDKNVPDREKAERLHKTNQESVKKEVVGDKKPLAKVTKPVKKASEPKNGIDSSQKSVAETTAPSNERNETIFRVQILASSKNINLVPENFKGLTPLTREPFQNLYRYMYGKTNTLSQAKRLKHNADAKGYTTAYIVAYRNGVRIPMKEALKYVSE